MIDAPYVVAGIVTGLAVGLTGIGGGALMTPILLLIFGFAPRNAVATDLWFAVVTKVVAAAVHVRSGSVDWKVVTRLWSGSLPATLVVVFLIGIGIGGEPIPWLGRVIGFMVLVTAAGLFVSQRQNAMALGSSGPSTHALETRPDARTLWVVCAGATLGVCVSLTSIGAGALGSVMLLYLFPERMNPRTLVATDIVHAIPIAIAAGLGYLAVGLVDASALFNLLLGSVPAAIAGSLLARRVPARVLRMVLAGTLFVVGLRTIVG